MFEQSGTEQAEFPEMMERNESLEDKIDCLLEEAKDPKANLMAVSTQIVDLVLQNRFGFTDYFLFEFEREKLIKKLAILLDKFPDHSIKGKAVLDLGCGNRGGTEERANRDSRNQPWFCRLLKIIGASPVGVDIGRLKREDFPNLRRNLMKEAALDAIESRSADAVVADQLYTSPHLLKLKMRDRSLRIDKLRQKLFPQIQRILKTEGFYLEDDNADYFGYQTFNRDLLDHEQYAIKEVERMLNFIKTAPEGEKHHIAQQITMLALPYLFREYEYAPDEETAQNIGFQCSAAFYILTLNFPDRERNNKTIVEVYANIPADRSCPKTVRANDPWISRFLDMVDTPVIPVRLDHLRQMFGLEPSEIYGQTMPLLQTNSVDALISPIMDTLPPEWQEHFTAAQKSITKPAGICIERNSHRVGKI